MRSIRWLVCGGALLLTVITVGMQLGSGASPSLVASALSQRFAQWASVALYLAVLIGPLTRVVPKLPGAGLLVQARRSIGVSAFLFALLHTGWSFFGELQGFEGVSFLSTSFQAALLIGLGSLIILAALALTSIDQVVRRLGPWWKRLHRFVYLALVLGVIHGVLLSTAEPPLPVSWYLALWFYVGLHAHLADTRRGSQIFTLLTMLVGVVGFTWLLGTGGEGLSLHFRHLGR